MEHKIVFEKCNFRTKKVYKYLHIVTIRNNINLKLVWIKMKKTVLFLITFISVHVESASFRQVQSQQVTQVNTDCSICCEDFVANTDTVKPYQCLNGGHIFHRKCFTDWQSQSNQQQQKNCPLCRSIVKPGFMFACSLTNAVIADDYQLVNRLLSNNIVYPDSHFNLDFRNFYSYTPLTLAAGNSSTQIVQRLISAGADINGTSSQRTTPLIAAIINNKYLNSVLLLNSSANVNTVFQDSNAMNETLKSVSRNFNKDDLRSVEYVFDKLLSSGVDLSYRDSQGNNYLHTSLDVLNEELFRPDNIKTMSKLIIKLINSGVDPFASNSQGITPYSKMLDCKD